MAPKKPSKNKTTSKTSNGDLAVLIEALRDDVRQVAEGQSGLVQKIEDVRLELKAEIQDKYALLSGAIAQTQEDVVQIKGELSQTREELRGEIQSLREEFHTHTHTL